MLKQFEAPYKYIFDKLIFEKLTVNDMEQDYVAVKSNASFIRTMMNSSWPSDNISEEKNLSDLKRHETEFNLKKAFAYSIRDNMTEEYIGCLYIKPFKLLKLIKVIKISFWITQHSFKLGLYDNITRAIDTFLKSWPSIQKIYPKHDMEKLRKYIRSSKMLT